MLTSVLIAALSAGTPTQTAANAELDTSANNTLRVLVWNVLHGANDVTQGAEKTLADHSRRGARHCLDAGEL